ncbi:MAG: phenylalanine--tRNA ligase subunit beta [Alphaproteobacteria bacterium]|nr:phenylalanine--tRNA ligase subunit beta [Alphaproteobacteria bacterium]
MKFTLSWLKDHLDTDAGIDAIVDAMTMAGLEVEHVENPGEKLKAFSVAKIVEAVQHPNADRLRVCQVDTKDGRKEIVCGAPNARPGLVTIYAPLGTYVPGSGITLEARPVRGVVSNGMLCSGAELEVDSDGDGILELDAKLVVGTPAAEALGLSDAVIDFEVTPNRPDWLGVDGIARDLAAAGLGKFVAKPVKPVKGAFVSPTPVATQDASACPAFAARYIRGVKNVASPPWLQQKLKAIGLKPRSALVDITNYLCFDRARPLHVYDAAKLSGTVRARLGKAGEKFVALDGETYEITPDMCVIADDAQVLGLGGVMGGETSGVSDATVDVLLESAWFDPLRTAQTGRATGINSDAKYRFERGVDPGFILGGLELATQLILDICGGEASEPMLAGVIPAPPKPVTFDTARVKALAGLDVKPERAKEILTALGFTLGGDAKKLAVQPPTWRRDVEGSADLVEEIARIEGYDKLPANEPPRANGYRAPSASVGESRTRLVRRALAGAGYFECVTWSFCERKHAELFGGGSEKLVLANPIASDLDCMRPSALPNLLRAAQRNLDRGRGDLMLFEAGPAWSDDTDTGQSRTVSAIRQPRPKRSWRGADAPDVFDIKRDCLMALEAMGAPVSSLQTGAAEAPWQHPGRGGSLKLGNKVIATFGDVHPRILNALDVEGPAMAFEIKVDLIPAPRAKATHARPALEKLDLMPLTRDFAFVVEEKVAAADLVRAAYGADKQLVADVTLFDVYRGKGVDDGKKSLAIEVTLQPREKTLGDGDIEDVSKKIVAAVAKATGGSLRG